MKKRKILFIVPRFHTNLYYQIEALQEAGYKVRVLVLYKGLSERWEGVEVVRIGYSWLYEKFARFFIRKDSYLKSSLELRLGFPSLRVLRKEINEFVPDVIFLKAYLNIFAFSVLLSNVCKKNKLFVLTQTKKDNINGSVLALRIFFVFSKLFRVRSYISPIEKTKEILDKFKGINVFYLPFTFPLVKGLELNRRRGDILRIMTVGKFVKRKEILLLLQAFNGLIKEGFSDLRLNIFGEKADLDYARRVEDYIKRNQLEDFVKVRYNLDNKKIIKEYRKHDIFVLPSSKEPAAYSVVEAMGSGLPVICSSECGTKSYINGNGFIFKSGDVFDLKNKMKLLLKKDNIQKMSAKSVELVIQDHEKQVFLKKIEKIIK